LGVLIIFIEALLFFVLFFGIAFILNMLLRSTWIMSIIFPIIIIFIIDDVSFWDYFTSPGTSFPALWDAFINLQIVDVAILLTGFVGTIVAGIVIKMLRKSGYRMF